MYSAFPLMFYWFYLFSQFEKSQVLSQQLTLEEIQQYDTSNVNDSVIRSVFAQNVDANETLATNRCKSCLIREVQKRKRINSIKKKISHALKLDIFGLPNVTERRLPLVPSYQRLMERFEIRENMQLDSPHSYRSLLNDEEEENGRPERTYMFAKAVPESVGSVEPNTIFFETSKFEQREIRRALLWIHINPRNPNFRVPNNVTEIFLFSLVPPGKSGGSPIRNYIMKRKRRPHQTVGWHHFDITWLVSLWARHPERNLGLVVEAFDDDNSNMIVLPETTLPNEAYEPMLDVKTSIYLGGHRSKRSVDLRCDENDQVEACCRYPLIVDFVEFGWDFVIAPIRYAAYYCAGSCEHEHIDEHAHARLMQEVNERRVLPCCTPTRLSPLAMLYFDHHENIEMTTLPNMKVERCSCQ